MAEATTSAIPSATATSPSLYLPLSTAPPDPLGFSQISGFYGPGTWAAWYLTMSASWLHLRIGADNKLDANTWAYLLGLNWAAIDFLRHAHQISILYGNGSADELWSKEGGSAGAAFTVVFWGVLHAVAQLLSCCTFTSCRSWQKGITLISGLLLPSVSLALAGSYLDVLGDRHDIADFIPALYWAGIPATSDSNSPYGHDIYLGIASLFGIWCLVFCIVVVFYVSFQSIPESSVRAFRAAMRQPMNQWRKVRPCYFCLLVLTFYVMMILISATRDLTYLLAAIPFAPYLLSFYFVVYPIFSGMCFLYVSVGYVFRAYFGLGSSPSQSCFFMPCAPQSISEMDQAGALFVGLVLFIGVEVALPVSARFKKDYMERRQFEQAVNRRISSDRMRRLISGNIEDQGTVDESITTARRVNSGIALEEGRASGPRGGRVDSGITQDESEVVAPGLSRRTTLGITEQQAQEALGNVQE